MQMESPSVFQAEAQARNFSIELPPWRVAHRLDGAHVQEGVEHVAGVPLLLRHQGVAAEREKRLCYSIVPSMVYNGHLKL